MRNQKCLQFREPSPLQWQLVPPWFYAPIVFTTFVHSDKWHKKCYPFLCFVFRFLSRAIKFFTRFTSLWRPKASMRVKDMPRDDWLTLTSSVCFPFHLPFLFLLFILVFDRLSDWLVLSDAMARSVLLLALTGCSLSLSVSGWFVSPASCWDNSREFDAELSAVSLTTSLLASSDSFSLSTDDQKVIFCAVREVNGSAILHTWINWAADAASWPGLSPSAWTYSRLYTPLR